ncbi:MAG: 16S rRNA (adenine(1518)-N(6)/adenine(1519)-N(6))-dimethyltransferase RsmA [Myxococcota bacterium]
MIDSPGVVLRRHGLWARKSWGQHFLHDPGVLSAIVGAIDPSRERRIVEIGAGLGTLTGRLLEAGAEVWAVERDRDMCDVLRQELADFERFTLHEADAVKFDYAAAAREGVPADIVGNLPYHLTGPLMFALLAEHTRTGRWVVMVQREVARRMCAQPGTKQYGSLTVVLSRLRVLRPVIDAPPGAFLPPPKVDSAVVLLEARDTPRGEVGRAADFQAMVRTTFQQRRKTLLNALSPLSGKERARAWCETAGVDHRLRPERLEPEHFAALQRAREADAAGDDA